MFEQLRPKTDRIVIHCSATRPSQDIGADWIDQVHRDQGFDRIGYHFVIRRDGSVELGRGLDEIGAHARSWNHRSVGICLVGGVAEDGRTPEANFTTAQWASLDTVVRMLAEVYPEAKIIGHRDLPNVCKACPCFDVAEWVRTGDPQGEVMPTPAPAAALKEPADPALRWRRTGPRHAATVAHVLDEARVLAFAVQAGDQPGIRRGAARVARTVTRLDAQAQGAP